VPVTPHQPVIAFETFSLAGTPIALGTAPSSAFHERGLESFDSSNAVDNEAIVGPVPNLCEDWQEDWCSPTEWMCTTPNLNTAQLLDMDRYSSKSLMTPMLYDSQNITSQMFMSYNARSPSPQLYSSPNHTPTPSAPSPENLSDLLAWDSLHRGHEAASAELLSPEIRVSIKAISVPPALPQSKSINAALAGKEYRCPLCGIHFTQSQVLNRHIKDKHEFKESCTNCSSFKWSRGRPHLYRRHLRVKHPGLTFSEDPPGGTRRAQVSRARQCKVQKAQVTSRGLVPNQLECCPTIDLTISQNYLFLTQAIYALTNTAPAIYPSNYSCRGIAVVCMVYTCSHV
jgi:hypothetical protein